MKGRYFIKIGGERLPAEIEAMSNYFEFDSTEDMIDRLVLRFNNTDGRLLELQYFRHGNEIEFTFGQDESQMSEVRKFTIRKISGFNVLTVIAYEPAHAIMTHSRSKIYANMTIDEIAAMKARENGLQFEGDSFPLRYTQLAQVNETDMRFLKRLAARVNAIVYRDGRKLYFLKKRYEGQPVQEYRIDSNGGFDRGKAIDFQPTETNLGIPWEVTAAGMDPLTLAPFEVRANGSNVKRKVLGPETILQGGAAGLPAPRTGQTGVRYYTAARSAMQAMQEASARFEACEADMLQATVTLWGDPNVLANRLIRLTADTPRFSGLYRVTRARHIIAGSYKILAEVERNATGSESGGSRTGGTVIR